MTTSHARLEKDLCTLRASKLTATTGQWASVRRLPVTSRAIIKTVVECLVSIVAGAAGLALGDQGHADRRVASFHFEQIFMTGIAAVANTVQPVGEKCRWKRACRSFITFTLKLQITRRAETHDRRNKRHQHAAKQQRIPYHFYFNWYQHFG